MRALHTPTDGAVYRQARRSWLAVAGAAVAVGGVVLGLENHGGIVATADGLFEIVQAVRSPWFGVNLDTGNFHSADPYAELARCVPYAVNVQYKVEIRRGEKAPPEPADAARLVKLLRDGGHQGFLTLEYEAAEDPFAAVPRHLAGLRRLIA
jgi:sugar phosphate isomerase/epimerase